MSGGESGSLDVFAVHGVGGMIGLLVAFLSVSVLGANGLTVESGAIGSQLGCRPWEWLSRWLGRLYSL